MKTGSIRLFGKNVISTFNHHIMSLQYSSNIAATNKLVMECITEQPDKMIDGTYSVETAKALLAKNKGKCDVFIFHDSNENVVGTLSVMYKNGNDIEYKIRKADAFIYNVLTDEKHRGRGYAGEMLRLLSEYLHGKSIDKAYLAVSTNNTSAIRAYEKIGFVTEYDSSFIRVLKVNIPYRQL